MPEAIPAENSAVTMSVVKDAAVLAMLEDYAHYLMKHHKVNSTEECKDRLGEVVTLAMDRGDASENTLAQLDRWLSKQTVHTDLTSLSRHVDRFMTHALTEESCEILNSDQLDDAAYAEFRAVDKLRRQYEDAASNLIAKYGHQLNTMAYRFLNNYKSAFDPEFVSKIDRAAQIQQIQA